MADVFVSYSRRDSEYVRRLARELKARGKQAWIDIDGIRDAEVFPAALRRAIESSDAFVFVISPEAVRSQFCEQEVAHASELNKRIVPVALREVPDDELPEAIRVRNWIPAVENGDLSDSVDRLVAAIETDLEWERMHTRLTVKALEWDRSGRDRSFLVRGSELQAAEQWLAAGAARPKGGHPTALEQAYLLAARRATSRRLRTVVGVSAAVAVVAVALLVFALISRGQAISAQAVATSRALAAESQNQLAVDPELSILLAMRAVRASPTPDALFALRAAIDGSPLRRTLLTTAQVGCQLQGGPSLAYSPSVGLAEGLCGGTPGPGRPPPRGRVLVFDPRNGHVVMQTRVGLGGLSAIALSPDGSVLAAAGANGRVLLLDPHTGAPRGSLGTPAFGPGGAPRGPVVLPTDVAFSPDGSQLIVLTSEARLWSLRRHSSVVLEGAAVPGPTGPGLLAAAFVAGGRAVVLAGANDARVYDTRTASLLRVLPVGGSIGALAVSPDGRELAVGSLSPSQVGAVATVWSARTWRKTATVAVIAQRTINSLAFSPDGKDLAIGASDGSAGLWSVRTHDQLAAYLGSTSQVMSIAFMPDQAQVATASLDGTTKVWRAGGPELVSIDSHASDVRLSGARLTAVVGPNVIRSWVLPAAAPQSPITNHDPRSAGLLLSPDGSASVEPLYDPNAGVFTGFLVRSATDGQLLGKFTAPPLLAVSGFGVSADGRKLLVLGNQSQEVADLTGRHVVRLHATPGSSVRGITGCHWFTGAISPDGRLAAGADQCGGVTIWDARSGVQRERVGVSGLVPEIAFSPDGRHLAAASGDSTITIWDVRTAQVAHVLHGHTLGVNGVAYSPNGELLASAGLDDTLRVWDPSSGRLLRVWRNPAPLNSVAFSSDGKRIVSADFQGTIRMWDACTACENASALLAIGQRSVTRQLTPLERATFLASL